jgi:hypothetical protein
MKVQGKLKVRPFFNKLVNESIFGKFHVGGREKNKTISIQLLFFFNRSTFASVRLVGEKNILKFIPKYDITGKHYIKKP